MPRGRERARVRGEVLGHLLRHRLVHLLAAALDGMSRADVRAGAIAATSAAIVRMNPAEAARAPDGRRRSPPAFGRRSCATRSRAWNRAARRRAQREDDEARPSAVGAVDRVDHVVRGDRVDDAVDDGGVDDGCVAGAPGAVRAVRIPVSGREATLVGPIVSARPNACNRHATDENTCSHERPAEGPCRHYRSRAGWQLSPDARHLGFHDRRDDLAHAEGQLRARRECRLDGGFGFNRLVHDELHVAGAASSTAPCASRDGCRNGQRHDRQGRPAPPGTGCRP